MGETELARRLGISRKALWERRQRLGIPRTGMHGATNLTPSVRRNHPTLEVGT